MITRSDMVVLGGAALVLLGFTVPWVAGDLDSTGWRLGQPHPYAALALALLVAASALWYGAASPARPKAAFAQALLSAVAFASLFLNMLPSPSPMGPGLLCTFAGFAAAFLGSLSAFYAGRRAAPAPTIEGRGVLPGASPVPPRGGAV